MKPEPPSRFRRAAALTGLALAVPSLSSCVYDGYAGVGYTEFYAPPPPPVVVHRSYYRAPDYCPPPGTTTALLPATTRSHAAATSADTRTGTAAPGIATTDK